MTSPLVGEDKIAKVLLMTSPLIVRFFLDNILNPYLLRRL
jgi:hypothetical protein